MLMEIYNILIEDDFIIDNVGKNRIKFYEVPEVFDVDQPFIVISPTDTPNPMTHASDKELSQSMLFQINVESNNRILTKQIQQAVKKALESHDFMQTNGGLDTYFNETKRYVDARRYRITTKLYQNHY